MKKKIKHSILLAIVFATTTSLKAQSIWSKNGNNVYLTDSTKNVCIGSSSPSGSSKLEINGGSLHFYNTPTHGKISMHASSATNENRIYSMDQNGNWLWYISMGRRTNGNQFSLYSGATGDYVFNVSTSGNVGIKTGYSTAYALQVCGAIKATEIRVQTGWCDYVFNKDYELRPLEDVKEFITQNKHLPDVTPGPQIESEGLDVGATSSQMIRKIEELTLYMIQQNDEIKNLKNEISILKENQKQ